VKQRLFKVQTLKICLHMPETVGKRRPHPQAGWQLVRVRCRVIRITGHCQDAEGGSSVGVPGC
jgi:uncharacterized protein YcnI